MCVPCPLLDFFDKKSWYARHWENVERCQLCEIRKTGQHQCPGLGYPNSAIMFVGEAPGAVDNPELRNLVFVGNKSSDLMLDIIYDLWPNGYDDVYLTNVVKCNPPGNRQPTENEVECCSKFLREEIRMVNPIFIVALGRTAANWFGVTSNLNEARLTPHLWESRRLFVLYHPAYVLRLGPKAVSQFRGQMKVIRNHLIDLEIRCEEK